MRLAEISAKEVSGASEVSQSRDKSIFRSPAAVLLLKNRSRSSKIVSMEIIDQLEY